MNPLQTRSYAEPSRFPAARRPPPPPPASLPMSLVKLAFADPALDFTFGYISDAHIQHV